MRDLGTLGATVQAVRAGSFPDLPANLIDEILAVEAESYEDRYMARARVSAALNAHLKNETTA